MTPSKGTKRTKTKAKLCLQQNKAYNFQTKIIQESISSYSSQHNKNNDFFHKEHQEELLPQLQFPANQNLGLSFEFAVSKRITEMELYLAAHRLNRDPLELSKCLKNSQKQEIMTSISSLFLVVQKWRYQAGVSPWHIAHAICLLEDCLKILKDIFEFDFGDLEIIWNVCILLSLKLMEEVNLFRIEDASLISGFSNTKLTKMESYLIKDVLNYHIWKNDEKVNMVLSHLLKKAEGFINISETKKGAVKE